MAVPSLGLSHTDARCSRNYRDLLLKNLFLVGYILYDACDLKES